MKPYSEKWLEGFHSVLLNPPPPRHVAFRQIGSKPLLRLVIIFQNTSQGNGVIDRLVSTFFLHEVHSLLNGVEWSLNTSLLHELKQMLLHGV